MSGALESVDFSLYRQASWLIFTRNYLRITRRSSQLKMGCTSRCAKSRVNLSASVDVNRDSPLVDYHRVPAAPGMVASRCISESCCFLLKRFVMLVA